MLRCGCLPSALRSAAVSEAAAMVYCSLSRPYASAMVRSPVMWNAPKRSHERSSDSRKTISAESSEMNFSVEGETFMMSKSGMNVFSGAFEASKIWEKAKAARCRLVCMILEKVEAGLEPESERGGPRSSEGMISTISIRSFITWAPRLIKLTFCIAIVDTNQ